MHRVAGKDDAPCGVLSYGVYPSPKQELITATNSTTARGSTGNARATVEDRQSEACLSPSDNMLHQTENKVFHVKVCATVIDNTMREIERCFSNTYCSNMKDIQARNPLSSRFFFFLREKVFFCWSQVL